MALPFVYAVGTAASGAANITPGIPAGTVADDVLILFVETQNEVVPAVSGYADVTGSPVIVSTGTVTRLTVRWHRATGPESGTITITDPGDHAIARIVGVRGCITQGDPWDGGVASGTELVSDTSVAIPGATTSVPNCLVLAAVATGTDVASTAHASAGANADLANVTERCDDWTSLGLGGGFAVWSGEKLTQGTYGNTTATLVTANFKALLSLALRGPIEVGFVSTLVHPGRGPFFAGGRFYYSPRSTFVPPPACFTRDFDGAGDFVQTAVGGVPDATPGNKTFVAIVKRLANSGGSRKAIIGLNATSPVDVNAGFHFGDPGLSDCLALFNDGSANVSRTTTITVTTTDGWCLVAAGKASGSATPRFHKYNYGTQAWTHEDGNAAIGDGTFTGFASCEIGAWVSGFDVSTARFAVAGIFPGVLSDGNLETMELALQAFVDLSPVALWRLDQDSPATPVPDIVGGADETSHTGTTAVQDCPAGFVWTLGGAPATNAPAEAAIGTGAADNANVAVAANADQATGSGAAQAPTAAAGANAEAATGTGAALDATVQTSAGTNAPAEAASGSAAALDASIAITVNAGVATGVGVAAEGATADVTADAGLASGTGEAPDATVQVSGAANAPAGIASGTGQASDAQVAMTVPAGIASGIGTAPDAQGGIGAQAEAANGVGAALDALAAITVNADQATGTGSAPDPTVSTVAATSAPAELASGTGAALDATVAITVPAGVATGTGAANNATVLIGQEAPAGLASGTGSAPDVTVAIGVPAEAAAGIGVAFDATVAFTIFPSQPPGFVVLAAAGGHAIAGGTDGTVVMQDVGGKVTVG